MSGPGAVAVRIYHAVNLCILCLGAVCWLRVVKQWRLTYRKASPIIRSYAFLAAVDFVTLTNYLCLSIAGLIQGQLPRLRSGALHVACRVSAFVAMTSFFTLSGSYIAVLLSTYLFVGGQTDLRRLADISLCVNLVNSAAFMVGVLLGSFFWATEATGNYRDLYCLVRDPELDGLPLPQKRDVVVGFIAALVYFSLTTAALVFFWLGPRTLLHCRSLQRASSSNALNIRPVEKGGKIAALVRMKSASSPEEGKLAFRLKAFGIVSKTASTLLSIFFVTNVGTMVNECLRVAGVTVPLWVDLISGILYCFQPVFNCWLQHSILKRVVLRVHAHRRALTSHTTQDVPQLLEEQREITLAALHEQLDDLDDGAMGNQGVNTFHFRESLLSGWSRHASSFASWGATDRDMSGRGVSGSKLSAVQEGADMEEGRGHKSPQQQGRARVLTQSGGGEERPSNVNVAPVRSARSVMEMVFLRRMPSNDTTQPSTRRERDTSTSSSMSFLAASSNAPARQRGSLSEGPGLYDLGDNPDPRAWGEIGGHFTHELPETPRKDAEKKHRGQGGGHFAHELPETPRKDAEKKHRGQGGWAGNGPREGLGSIRPAPIPPLRPLGGNTNPSGSLPRAPGEGGLTARLSGSLPKEKAALEAVSPRGNLKLQREEPQLTAEEAMLVEGVGNYGIGLWTL